MEGLITHPHSGDVVGVPDDWDTHVPPGTEALVAVAPERPDGGFRPNLVLTVTDNEGWTFAQWQRSTEAELPMALQDYLLLDQQRLEIAGQPAGRRLAHHTTPDGTAVTMEQWFVAIGDRGHTLTMTVPDLEFPDHTALIEEIVASWQPGGPRD